MKNPTAAPATNLSRRGNTPAPGSKEDDRGGEDDGLPNRQMERLEPLRAVTANQVESHHTNQIDRLNQNGAGDGGDEPLKRRRRKRQDCSDEKEDGLQSVAAVFDVDCEAWRAHDRAAHDHAL